MTTRNEILIKYGFTPWHGPHSVNTVPTANVMPVPYGTLIDVVYRCGDILGGAVAGLPATSLDDSAEALFWYDDDMACDIIGYRLAAPMNPADAAALGDAIAALCDEEGL